MQHLAGMVAFFCGCANATEREYDRTFRDAIMIVSTAIDEPIEALRGERSCLGSPPHHSLDRAVCQFVAQEGEAKSTSYPRSLIKFILPVPRAQPVSFQ